MTMEAAYYSNLILHCLWLAAKDFWSFKNRNVMAKLHSHVVISNKTAIKSMLLGFRKDKAKEL